MVQGVDSWFYVKAQASNPLMFYTNTASAYELIGALQRFSPLVFVQVSQPLLGGGWSAWENVTALYGRGP